MRGVFDNMRAGPSPPALLVEKHRPESEMGYERSSESSARVHREGGVGTISESVSLQDESGGWVNPSRLNARRMRCTAQTGKGD